MSRAIQVRPDEFGGTLSGKPEHPGRGAAPFENLCSNPQEIMIAFPVSRLVPLLLVIGAGCQPATRTAAHMPAPAGGATEMQPADFARTARGGSEVSEHAYQLIDFIGPRMSDSPGGRQAREYAGSQLRRYGLENVREERFPLLAWHRDRATLTILDPAELASREVSVLSLGHVGDHAVEAPLVDAGFAVAEDFARLGSAVRGAIVLAHPGQPEGYGRGVHRSEKIALAEGAGAAGFVLVAPASLVQIGVATLGDHATQIPAVAADYEGGNWLARILIRHPGGVRVRIATANRMQRAEDANVLADLRGRGDEVVLVGAHLDSWDLATGAVDNGSGSIAVLDIARALAEHVRRTGERPLRTIRFALWMGEELGLYGSNHHVAAAVRDGSIDRYAAVLNLDVVGVPTGLGAMGRPEVASFLGPIAHELSAGDWLTSTKISTGGSLYSDHMGFLFEGIPIFTLGSRLPARAANVSHTSADTRDKLDEQGIANSVAVSAALLWALANEPTLPVRRWSAAETGRQLEAMGLRDPIERSGAWRWD
ncbi:M28 family metallopeptidase [soil metagenome]